jgi:hypothetical protein
MSSGKVHLSICDMASGWWGLICIYLFSRVAHLAFNDLFIVKQEGETFRSILGKLFEWPVETRFIYLVGSIICVVSAVIHLGLLLSKRIYLARRYGLIRNISSLVVLITYCIDIYLFLESFGDGNPWYN